MEGSVSGGGGEVRGRKNSKIEGFKEGYPGYYDLIYENGDSRFDRVRSLAHGHDLSIFSQNGQSYHILSR
jgi:hypothetical protein